MAYRFVPLSALSGRYPLLPCSHAMTKISRPSIDSHRPKHQTCARPHAHSWGIRVRRAKLLSGQGLRSEGGLSDTSERQLIEHSVTGDADALAELLVVMDGRLRARLVGQIGRRYRSAFGIDDVLQVTYTEAFLRIRSFRPSGDGAFLNWLTRIAENTLRNAIRDLNCQKRPPRNRQIGNLPGGDSYVALIETLAGSRTSPSQCACREEGRAAIEAALAIMPPDYAKVIRMFYLEGRDASEIATELERSTGAVYMLKARAWDQLAELLGDATRFFSHTA